MRGCVCVVVSVCMCVCGVCVCGWQGAFTPATVRPVTGVIG